MQLTTIVGNLIEHGSRIGPLYSPGCVLGLVDISYVKIPSAYSCVTPTNSRAPCTPHVHRCRSMLRLSLSLSLSLSIYLSIYLSLSRNQSHSPPPTTPALSSSRPRCVSCVSLVVCAERHPSSGGHALSGGAIAGIVIGIVVLLAAIALLWWKQARARGSRAR
jgi:hypothetical protein